MQKQVRLPYIDIAKGAAMLLVIIGHCSYSPMGLIGWLYSFHMPLFFALSGFTFRPEKYRNLRALLAEKARTLLVPYFALCLIVWALCLLLLDGMQLESRHVNELIGIVLSKRLSKYFFNLWFLTVLFLGQPLLWIILKAARGKKRIILLAAAAAYVLGAFVVRHVKGTYWSADLVPIALCFLLLGYALRAWMNRHPACGAKPLALLWGLNLLFFYLNYAQVGRSDLYYCKLGNPLFFFIAACAGAAGSILLCRRVGRCAPLAWIGKNSLAFYAFEALTIPLSERLIRLVFPSVSTPSIPALFAVLLLSCAMMAAFSIFINRFCPCILGKSARHA